mgnify:CR=1 FL=1
MVLEKNGLPAKTTWGSEGLWKIYQKLRIENNKTERKWIKIKNSISSGPVDSQMRRTKLSTFKAILIFFK